MRSRAAKYSARCCAAKRAPPSLPHSVRMAAGHLDGSFNDSGRLPSLSRTWARLAISSSENMNPPKWLIPSPSISPMTIPSLRVAVFGLL